MVMGRTMTDSSLRRQFYEERARRLREWTGRAEEAANTLGRIEHLLKTLLQGQEDLMTAIDDLTAAVAAEDAVIDSAVVLLGGLKKALDDAIASGNPAALTALSADIGAKTKALSDAVAINTPAAP